MTEKIKLRNSEKKRTPSILEKFGEVSAALAKILTPVKSDNFSEMVEELERERQKRESKIKGILDPEDFEVANNASYKGEVKKSA